MSDISLFDALLMKFCNHVQDIYAITPNMHMHGQIVEDYGPVYGFWLKDIMEFLVTNPTIIVLLNHS